MSDTAYHLSSRFIDELWERINSLVESATPSEIFGNLFKDIDNVPSKEHLSAIIDTAFWTSFTKEEGNSVTASIILKKADSAADTFCFDTPIPLNVKNLVKLGAALENPRADIGIWPGEDGYLEIWGFKTHSEDTLIADLWVQALGPGRVLVTYGGKSLGALTSNKADFIDYSNLMRTVMPKLSTGLDENEGKMLRFLRYNSLLATARAMRGHGRGGTLLVVPDNNEWERSIQTPTLYTGGASFLDSNYDLSKKPSLLLPGIEMITSLIRKKITSKRDELFRMREQVEQQCRRIARLTAVDGALVMTFDRYVFCFGAKIIPTEGQDSPVSLRVLEPVEGDSGYPINLTDVGGTRHQSAAQFAHAHPDSVAVAVSQDGDVTFFTMDTVSGDLIVVRQAELALLHEGVGAAIWNYSRFSELGWI